MREQKKRQTIRSANINRDKYHYAELFRVFCHSQSVQLILRHSIRLLVGGGAAAAGIFFICLCNMHFAFRRQTTTATNKKKSAPKQDGHREQYERAKKKCHDDPSTTEKYAQNS